MTLKKRAASWLAVGIFGVAIGTVIAVLNGMTLVNVGLVADATGTTGHVDPALLALGALGAALAIAGFMIAAINFAKWRTTSS